MGALRMTFPELDETIRPASRPPRPIALVAHARHARLDEVCEACGEGSASLLCPECLEQARPHLADDPYDDVGGEEGWAS